MLDGTPFPPSDRQVESHALLAPPPAPAHWRYASHPLLPPVDDVPAANPPVARPPPPPDDAPFPPFCPASPPAPPPGWSTITVPPHCMRDVPPVLPVGLPEVPPPAPTVIVHVPAGRVIYVHVTPPPPPPPPPPPFTPSMPFPPLPPPPTTNTCVYKLVDRVSVPLEFHFR